MKQVADVKLSNHRSATVYYGWQCEAGDMALTMRIEAVTEGAVRGLSRKDQLALLDVVRKVITTH